MPTFYQFPNGAIEPTHRITPNGRTEPIFYNVPIGYAAPIYCMAPDGRTEPAYCMTPDGSMAQLCYEVPNFNTAQFAWKEPKIGYADYDEIDNIGASIMFFVFDEAHYFTSDARFSETTGFWLKALRGMPKASSRIFFTATPEPLYYFLYAVYKADLRQDLIKRIQDGRNVTSAAKAVDELLPKNPARAKWPNIMGTKNDRLKVALGTIYRYCQDAGCAETGYSDEESVLIRTYRKYKEMNPDLDPFFGMTDFLEGEAKRQKEQIFHVESDALVNEYDKMNAHYFLDYGDLLPLIKDTPPNEKWVIFIDNKADGSTLSEELNAVGCSTTLLSRDSINTKRGDVEYQSIVSQQKFASKVLIATELMDCGVSIHDVDVKHVVISHSRKAVFLQMLGRVRLDETEKVNLYLKCESAVKIQAQKRKIIQTIYDLVDVELLNAEKYVPEVIDGVMTYRAKPYWDDDERARIFNKFISNRSNLNYINVKFETYWQDNANRDKYPSFLGMEISELGLLSLLYDVSAYLGAIKLRKDGDDNRAFYVKYQLGWLGKEYDVTRWVGYEQSVEAVRDYCKEVGNVGAPPEEVKSELMKRFLICSFLPKSLYADKAKYEREGRLPGRKKLNAALRERKIGYAIESKQIRIGGKQVTRWRFAPDVPCDSNDDAHDVL